MAIDYNKISSQYNEMKKKQTARAVTYSYDTQNETPSGGGGIFSTLGGVAKEVYKGIVRPFTTPVAGFYSGIQGLRGKDREVELPEWLGSAKASGDLDKQARIAGGAALEALSLLPAGKALTGLRALKGGAPLKTLAWREAKYGMKTGVMGGAGYELGQNEDATLSSVASAGLIGGSVGGVLGGFLPIGGRVFTKLKSWNKEADYIVEEALKKQQPTKDIGSNWTQSKKIDTPSINYPLSEIDDDIFPEIAMDATPVSESIKKKAKNSGFKEWQVNLISEMGEGEKAIARELVSMAENKSQNILAKSPYERAADPIVKQVKHLQNVKKESGEILDSLVEEMPNKPVSLEEPVKGFDNWLASKDIDIVLDEKTGKQVLSFENSKFSTSASAKDQKIIQEVFSNLHPKKGEILNKTPNEIRTIRQRLFKILESNKKATDVFSSETETLLSAVRQELNSPLALLSKEYEKANKNYAVSKSRLENFLKFLGKDFYDATDEDISARIGEILPRLISNVGAKPGVIIKDLAEGAIETGMSREAIQDPRRLIHIAEMLNDLYDIKAPRGFQGSIERAGANVMESVKLATDIATVNPVSAVERTMKMFSGDPKPKQRQLLKQMLDYNNVNSNIAKTSKTALKKQGIESAAGLGIGMEMEKDENGIPTGKFKMAEGWRGFIGAGLATHSVSKKLTPEIIAKIRIETLVPRNLIAKVADLTLEQATRLGNFFLAGTSLIKDATKKKIINDETLLTDKIIEQIIPDKGYGRETFIALEEEARGVLDEMGIKHEKMDLNKLIDIIASFRDAHQYIREGLPEMFEQKQSVTKKRTIKNPKIKNNAPPKIRTMQQDIIDMENKKTAP